MEATTEIGGIATARAAGIATRTRPVAEALEGVFRHAAVINATLLKLSSLEQPGLDTNIYRSVLDSAIKELEAATSAYEVRKAEQRIARSTQMHLRAREELLTTREDEYKMTVETLTEAVVEFKEYDSAFAEQVLERSDRMKQAIAGDDLQTLRTRVAKELLELRGETLAKQEAQAKQLAALSSKVTALEARLDVVSAQAHRDQPTGLFNRTAWQQRMAELSVQLEEGDEAHAVALINIDGYQRTVDEHGRQAGDAMLAEFGDLCRQAFGDDDFLARLGGDEFVALISADEVEHATEHMDRLFSAVRRANDAAEPADRLPFTISAGLVPAGRQERVHALLRRAHLALAAAEQAGRDRLIVA